MKDNKSRGVDGMPPKLLKVVEKIVEKSTPLAKVFHLSREEGIFFQHGNKQTLRRYLSRDRGTSQKITDQ